MTITKYKELSNKINSSSLITKDLGAGNIVPHWWYRAITAGGGKPDFVAIIILSELWFLYRRSGEVEAVKNYSYYENKFNLTRTQMQDATLRLHKSGLVERSFRTIIVSGRKFPNELHLKINLNNLNSLRLQHDDSVSENSDYTDDDTFSDKGLVNSSSDSSEISEEYISNREISLRKNRSSESSFLKNSFKGLAQDKSNLASFYPLSDTDVALIQRASNRDFTAVAINEILLKLSKRYPTHSFPNKRTFISYMTKVMHFEKRDAVKTSGEDFKLNCNTNNKEKEQEAFLEKIENCKDVSSFNQLKRKLASVLDAETAYDLLQAICSEGRVVDNSFVFNLNKLINLSSSQRDLVLSQVQTIYGNDLNSFSIYSENSKIYVSHNNKASNANDITVCKETNSPAIWKKVRSQLIDYFGINGNDLDRAWFSKVEASTDDDSKTLNLKAPSSFIKDWITEKYSHLIERFCRQDQYSFVLS